MRVILYHKASRMSNGINIIMTQRFDTFCEAILQEIFTASSKRKEQKSRYWDTSMYPKAQPRAVQTMKSKTPSQRTKLGQQQYIGNIWDMDGPRGQNKSQKTPQEIALAKGNGGYLRRKGVNPYVPGSKVHSKQGNQEIKYNLANGVSKVGKVIPRDYDKNATKMKFIEN